jgi:hypothetical protein
MIGHGDARTLNLSLAEGAQVKYSARFEHVDAKAGEEALNRYGITPQTVFGNAENNDRVLDSLFKTARIMTERDGGHVTVLFLLRDAKPARIVKVEPETQDPCMNSIAPQAGVA